MAVDLDWSLLTNASGNFANALTGAAGQIRQHRETAKNREAFSNYLQNPTDQTAFAGAAERNPEMAFRVRDDTEQRAARLDARQREHLDFLGQILTDAQGRPIAPEAYPQALELARRAGIDVAGHETYDPNFVNSVVQLRSRLHRVAPVSVAEGAQLVNPETGQVVAASPQRPRYFPVPPGGRLELDPSYQGPTTEGPATGPIPPAPVPPARNGEAPAFAAPQPAAGVDEPALRRQAEAAIAAGRNPDMVWQRYRELVGGAASQAPQTFP